MAALDCLHQLLELPLLAGEAEEAVSTSGVTQQMLAAEAWEVAGQRLILAMSVRQVQQIQEVVAALVVI